MRPCCLWSRDTYAAFRACCWRWHIAWFLGLHKSRSWRVLVVCLGLAGGLGSLVNLWTFFFAYHTMAFALRRRHKFDPRGFIIVLARIWALWQGLSDFAHLLKRLRICSLLP